MMGEEERRVELEEKGNENSERGEGMMGKGMAGGIETRRSGAFGDPWGREGAKPSSPHHHSSARGPPEGDAFVCLLDR